MPNSPQECLFCLNYSSLPGESLCLTCATLNRWLPNVWYASEMDELGLVDVPGRYYFVYVLKTDKGVYVGHTGAIDSRLREHIDGKAPSTAHTNPKVAWQSKPFRTRRNADNAERVLKTLRDKMHKDFFRVTRVSPELMRDSDKS